MMNAEAASKSDPDPLHAWQHADLYSCSLQVSQAREVLDEKGKRTVQYRVDLLATANRLDLAHLRLHRWTRFSDAYSLQLAVELRHRQLRLRGRFPHFDKPSLAKTVFGSSDQSTLIPERLRQLNEFFSFVAKCEHLRCTPEVLQFVQQFTVSTDDNASLGEAMTPQPTHILALHSEDFRTSNAS